jgi:RNA polymerase sigma-70 factor (ECF subfamily)
MVKVVYKNMDELLEGLKKKDNGAFKEVMYLYKNKIYNYLKFLVNNDEVAEELTQDTFVKVYFKAYSIHTNNLTAWIYKVATNLARSEFRKKRIRYFFSLSDVENNCFSYETSIEDQELLKYLMSTLQEKYRIPVIMKEIDNFTFEDISNILNKPIGTIKTLVFRGKNQLKENLYKLIGEKNEKH